MHVVLRHCDVNLYHGRSISVSLPLCRNLRKNNDNVTQDLSTNHPVHVGEGGGEAEEEKAQRSRRVVRVRRGPWVPVFESSTRQKERQDNKRWVGCGAGY